MTLSDIGRALIGVGAVIAVLGAVLVLAGRAGLGRLPGDFSFGGDGVRVYVPLATLPASVVHRHRRTEPPRAPVSRRHTGADQLRSQHCAQGSGGLMHPNFPLSEWHGQGRKNTVEQSARRGRPGAWAASHGDGVPLAPGANCRRGGGRE